jgi:hypothetical protein
MPNIEKVQAILNWKGRKEDLQEAIRGLTIEDLQGLTQEQATATAQFGLESGLPLLHLIILHYRYEPLGSSKLPLLVDALCASGANVNDKVASNYYKGLNVLYVGLLNIYQFDAIADFDYAKRYYNFLQQYILPFTTDLNVVRNNGRSLFCAALDNSVAPVSFVLSLLLHPAGIDVNAGDGLAIQSYGDGSGILPMFAVFKHIDWTEDEKLAVIKQLLHHKMSQSDPSSNRTLLMYAVKYRCVTIVRELLENHAANPNAVDSNGFSVLMHLGDVPNTFVLDEKGKEIFAILVSKGAELFPSFRVRGKLRNGLWRVLYSVTSNDEYGLEKVFAFLAYLHGAFADEIKAMTRPIDQEPATQVHDFHAPGFKVMLDKEYDLTDILEMDLVDRLRLLDNMPSLPAYPIISTTPIATEPFAFTPQEIKAYVAQILDEQNWESLEEILRIAVHESQSQLPNQNADARPIKANTWFCIQFRRTSRTIMIEKSNEDSVRSSRYQADINRIVTAGIDLVSEHTRRPLILQLAKRGALAADVEAFITAIKQHMLGLLDPNDAYLSVEILKLRNDGVTNQVCEERGAQDDARLSTTPRPRQIAWA